LLFGDFTVVSIRMFVNLVCFGCFVLVIVLRLHGVSFLFVDFVVLLFDLLTFVILLAVASAVFAVLWWRLFCFALFVLVFGGLLVIILFCVFAAVGLCVILLGFGWFVNLGGIGFVVVVYCLGFGTCG